MRYLLPLLAVLLAGSAAAQGVYDPYPPSRDGFLVDVFEDGGRYVFRIDGYQPLEQAAMAVSLDVGGTLVVRVSEGLTVLGIVEPIDGLGDPLVGSDTIEARPGITAVQTKDRGSYIVRFLVCTLQEAEFCMGWTAVQPEDPTYLGDGFRLEVVPPAMDYDRGTGGGARPRDP